MQYLPSKILPNTHHWKKKWSQNGSSLELFWKTASLFKSGAIFSLIIMFVLKRYLNGGHPVDMKRLYPGAVSAPLFSFSDEQRFWILSEIGIRSTDHRDTSTIGSGICQWSATWPVICDHFLHITDFLMFSCSISMTWSSQEGSMVDL